MTEAIRVCVFFASGIATPGSTISQNAAALTAGSAPFYLCGACGISTFFEEKARKAARLCIKPCAPVELPPARVSRAIVLDSSGRFVIG